MKGRCWVKVLGGVVAVWESDGGREGQGEGLRECCLVCPGWGGVIGNDQAMRGKGVSSGHQDERPKERRVALDDLLMDKRH